MAGDDGLAADAHLIGAVGADRLETLRRVDDAGILHAAAVLHGERGAAVHADGGQAAEVEKLGAGIQNQHGAAVHGDDGVLHALLVALALAGLHDLRQVLAALMGAAVVEDHAVNAQARGGGALQVAHLDHGGVVAAAQGVARLGKLGAARKHAGALVAHQDHVFAQEAGGAADRQIAQEDDVNRIFLRGVGRLGRRRERGQGLCLAAVVPVAAGSGDKDLARLLRAQLGGVQRAGRGVLRPEDLLRFRAADGPFRQRGERQTQQHGEHKHEGQGAAQLSGHRYSSIQIANRGQARRSARSFL